MFKYLFRKNIKTDSDYKKYRLIEYAIIATAILELKLASGEMDFILGFLLGLGIVLLGYSLLIFRELSNPEILHAARIKTTDERRKQLELEIWAQAGRVLTCLIAIFLVVSFRQSLTLNNQMLIVIIYAILFYRAYRLRK
ncbi:MAG: hypothetical protein ACTIDA_01355 [Pseudolactococcus laudensis]